MEDEINIKRQIQFFLPLTMTSFLTVVTHSLFNAGLARLPSPEVYIAAFAVAKSLMHLFESPMMMVRQTVAALVDNGESFAKVRSFMLTTVSLVVVFFAAVVLSGGAGWIIKNVMGLEGETLKAAETILRVFVVFPLAATLRNFNQGLMIKLQATPMLTVATIVRIIYVSVFVVSIPRFTLLLPPSIIAGLMFLSAISVEALILACGSKLVFGNIRQRLTKRNSSATNISQRLILGFFGPLVVTAFIKTLAQPIINVGLARTAQPEVALAAYAVAWGLGMIVLSPLTMFHQVPLNFTDDNRPKKAIAVRNFAIGLGILLSLILAAMSFTGMGYFILRRIIGASPEISLMSVDVLKIMTILPLIMVTREFYWGLLMKRRVTMYLSKGKTVNLVALTTATLLMIAVRPSNPAVVGITAMVAAESAEALYLAWSTKRYEFKENVSKNRAYLIGDRS